MTQYHELAAHILGMKVSEIITVQRVDTGYVVTTHDGQRTLITHEGQTVPVTGGELVAEHGPELDLAEAPGHVASAEETGELAETDPATDDEHGEGDETGDEGDGEPEAVPDGTIEAVLAWVGDDHDRAERALAVENARATPRSTLTAALAKLLEGE